MAPVVPDPAKIASFTNAVAFERWLATNHVHANELWLRVFKKASGKATVTTAEALDVVLCWGWIDGIRKSYDEESFLQRYTPRRAKSLWSQVNQEHVRRLTEAGRMRPAGQKQVDAAKADGRWAAAYAPIRKASVHSIPQDLRRSIEANPLARKTFASLGKLNLFALAFRINAMRTPAGRAKKIEALVAMLARGETIVPEKSATASPTPMNALPMRPTGTRSRATKRAAAKRTSGS